ncbi:MAG: YkgJ family cysteine cluster protein [Candidatus Helarchaeota archaeon]
MNEFKCLKCGYCCHNIKSEGYERYIPIYSDEVEKLKNLAEKNKLSLKIEPDLLYPDILNKKLIIVTYIFKFEKVCAFYSENLGCTIYKDRPITCRAYPVAVWRADINYTMKVNTDCKFVEKNIDLISPKNYTELEKFFPKEYIQAKNLMIKGKEVIYRIIELEKQNKIDVGYLSGKLDFFYDLEKSEVEYKKWEKIDLYEIELD